MNRLRALLRPLTNQRTDEPIGTLGMSRASRNRITGVTRWQFAPAELDGPHWYPITVGQLGRIRVLCSSPEQVKQLLRVGAA
jgi:hypothetical protein